MRVASIHTYPIKGCHRLDQDRAAVEPWGLSGDRRWLIVDPERFAEIITNVVAMTDGGSVQAS